MRLGPYPLRFKARSFGSSNPRPGLERAALQLNIEQIVLKEIEGGAPEEFGSAILPRGLR
jgi:hypothetical protein